MYSKEPSFFELQKHMFKLMGKKIITILRSKLVFRIKMTMAIPSFDLQVARASFCKTMDFTVTDVGSLCMTIFFVVVYILERNPTKLKNNVQINFLLAVSLQDRVK